MNIQTLDILNAIHTKPFTNQRDLAKESGHSLGIVNRCIKELMEGGYIDEHMGFIKFGSRVDLYLPVGTKVNVKMGQKTVGNETIIAQL